MPRNVHRKNSRRRRSSKKKTTKRRSKKMRGGVTLRAQDLTRLPSDVLGEIREMHPLLTPKLNNITLRHAVKDYLDSSFKTRRYISLPQLCSWRSGSSPPPSISNASSLITTHDPRLNRCDRFFHIATSCLRDRCISWYLARSRAAAT